jgi:hypothetical protein
MVTPDIQEAPLQRNMGQRYDETTPKQFLPLQRWVLFGSCWHA